MTALHDRLKEFMGSTAARLTYGQGRLMLDHPDPKVRMRAAARLDLEPEVLFFLAGDPDARVRAIVAANPTAPHKTWLALAHDNSTKVRQALAQRLAALFGDNDSQSDSGLVRGATAALRLLVRDELPRVRRVLAQTLRNLPDAPHDVILALAHDTELAISLPVIHLSPVLSDADLIDIVKASPLAAQLDAVARRETVSDIVVDAIVHTGEARAIETLLRNPGAHVREETLDLITDLAPAYPTWHEPLVRRPHLPAHVVTKIAGFVADSLIAALSERADLDPSTVVYLKEMTRAGVDRSATNDLPPDDMALATDSRTLRLSMYRAESLLLAGRLGKAEAMKIIGKGLSALAVAALAVLARLPADAVARAVRRGNPLELLAIAWTAELGPEDAVVIQRKLGRVPSERVVGPAPGGWYAATEIELLRYLEKLHPKAEPVR